MKFFLSFFLIMAFLEPSISQDNEGEQLVKEGGHKTIPVMDFDELETYLKSYNDQVLVVNFWATWCAPCVEELHFFEDLSSDFEDRDVKVILVSLDFKRAMDTQLIPFLKRREIQSEVILLSDPKTNSWINRVSPHWSGAIPGTWFISGERTSFNEGKYTDYMDLINAISNFQKL